MTKCSQHLIWHRFLSKTLIHIWVLSISAFSFTDTDNLLKNKGRKWAIFISFYQLHFLSNIETFKCRHLARVYLAFLMKNHIITRLLLNEIYPPLVSTIFPYFRSTQYPRYTIFSRNLIQENLFKL